MNSTLQIPERMRALPRNALGLPVPYYAAVIDGVPDITRTSRTRHERCLQHGLCRMCGEPLGKYAAFITRPLATIDRAAITAPAHVECAKFAAETYPAPDGAEDSVRLVWSTRHFVPVPLADGRLLFQLGDPEQTFWYTRGRCASRDEVRVAMENALPALYEAAGEHGEAATMELDTMVARATRLFPKPATLAYAS